MKKKKRIRARLNQARARAAIQPLTPAIAPLNEMSAVAIAASVIDELTTENARLRKEAGIIYRLLSEQRHRADRALVIQRSMIEAMRTRKAWAKIKRAYALTPREVAQ